MRGLWLAARLLATAVLVLGAVLAVVLAVLFHWYWAVDASWHCPDAPGARVVGGGFGDGTWCRTADGATVGLAERRPLTLWDPWWSLLVSTAVVLAAVALALWGVRRIWRDRSEAWTIRRLPPVPTSS